DLSTSFGRRSTSLRRRETPQARDMAHLAAGPCLGLAVEMQAEVALGQQSVDAVDLVADQVLHGAVAMAAGVAERQAGNGADMLLELRHRAGGLRPVSGIVDARRDFVDEQSATLEHEEFDAENADIAERFENGESASAGCGRAFLS